jgi:hypothetical protein
MISDVGFFIFTYLLAFVYLLLRNHYLGLLPIFKFIGFLLLLLLDYLSSLCILGINPLSDEQFANIFSHAVGCLFIVNYFICCAEPFYFDVIRLSSIAFVARALDEAISSYPEAFL